MPEWIDEMLQILSRSLKSNWIMARKRHHLDLHISINRSIAHQLLKTIPAAATTLYDQQFRNSLNSLIRDSISEGIVWIIHLYHAIARKKNSGGRPTESVSSLHKSQFNWTQCFLLRLSIYRF